MSGTEGKIVFLFFILYYYISRKMFMFFFPQLFECFVRGRHLFTGQNKNWGDQVNHDIRTPDTTRLQKNILTFIPQFCKIMVNKKKIRISNVISLICFKWYFVFQGILLNEDREMDYFRVFCSVFTAVFTLIDVTYCP